MKRFPFATDHKEMARRHEVTLKSMEKEGIDCLVLQSNGTWLGGAMKYLTDLDCGGYPHMAVFAKEGISIIGHGAIGAKSVPAHLDLYNIVDSVARPGLISMYYADNWLPEEAVKVIKKNGYKKIGLVGMAYLTANAYKYLVESLSECEFVDASNLVDKIKAVKSEYELELWNECVSVHDKIMAAVPAFMRHGRSERDVARDIVQLADDLDCPVMNVMIGSHPTHPGLNPYLYNHKIIEKTDKVLLLIELATAGSVWGEVGRVFSFGDPGEDLRKIEKDSIYLQDLMAESCKPEVKASDIFNFLNERLGEMGYALEKRIPIHGQGYDIVDRPVFIADETMMLEENMFLAIHPGCSNDKGFMWNCDNYVVKADGAKLLNKTPRGLVIL